MAMTSKKSSSKRSKTKSKWTNKIVKMKTNILKFLQKGYDYFSHYLSIAFVERLLFLPNYIWFSAAVLFIAEILVSILVIRNIRYTEIDWEAYMSEVEGVVNGTWDYSELKGATGPLVYPAGFVYVFMVLYYLTDLGKNILCAQYIFGAIYLFNVILVFRIYHKTLKVPPYALVFMCCTSYRIHSIFMLRLFNDPIAMVFLYIAINLFLNDRWNSGCIFFSLAVSIKMNILLFAPALLLLLLAKFGLLKTIKKLMICAFVQLLLAFPFLMSNPVAYMTRAFDISRVFMYEWTVNWRFLPEHMFLNQRFHISLLLLHICCLIAFFCFKYPRLLILGFIELSWNIYPSTVASSMCLHICHFVMLCALWRAPPPSCNHPKVYIKKE
ncbi:Dol-P-Man:Man(5)GlcNAc(2)-PP-Dol alpha-1,3-mannosyltransferase [Nymphon striatum]|nr:Dol-P-Man:Man(5)GlcNAc(2)-PP-Dol alpha-1,3-mannosyltransferase [Nymphon striatum]